MPRRSPQSPWPAEDPARPGPRTPAGVAAALLLFLTVSSAAAAPPSRSTLATAAVVCVSDHTEIEVAGSAALAHRRQEQVFAIRSPGEISEQLRSVILVKSYEIHPLSASVQIRRAGGARHTYDLDDFQDLPYLSMGGFVSDSRMLHLRLPPLEAGDTLLIRQETRDEPFLGFPLQVFGGYLMPVVSAEYTVDIPRDLAPRFHSWNGAGDPEETPDGGRVRWSWRLGPLEPPPEELLQPPEQDFLPTVSIGVNRIAWGEAGTWEALAATYWRKVEEKVDPVPSASLIGRHPAENLSQFNRVLDQVQANVRYLSIALGPGGKIPYAADEVCRRKYGDCKDMSILLLSLLRQEGADGSLALVLTRPPAGLRVDPLPTLEYFNHAVACVERGGRDVWLDATHSYGTAETPRPDIQGAPALVVSGPRAGFRRISFGGADCSRYGVALTLTGSDDGRWRGTLRIHFVGSPAVNASYRTHESTGARKILQDAFKALREAPADADIDWSTLRVDAPRTDSLSMAVDFSARAPLAEGKGGRRLELAWNRDPYPISIFERRERATDVYWPELFTVTDSLTVIDSRLGPAGAADSTSTEAIDGIQARLEMHRRPGGVVFVRTVRVSEPIYPAARWSAAWQLRQRLVRWSTRDLPLSAPGG